MVLYRALEVNYILDSRGCTGFDWYGSGYRLQVERSSP